MMGIDLNLWIIGLLLFAGAAIFLFTIQASFTGGDDSVKKRLIQLQKERAATQKEVAPEWEKLIKEEEAKQRIDISRVIAKVTGASYVERLDRSLAEADIPMRCSEYLLMRLLLIVAPLLLFGFVFRNIMIGAFLAVVALLVPPLIVKSRSRARIDKFNNQLAEFLVLLVNALRAGQTFLQAVNHAIKESPEPIASEFKAIFPPNPPMQYSNQGRDLRPGERGRQAGTIPAWPMLDSATSGPKNIAGPETLAAAATSWSSQSGDGSQSSSVNASSGARLALSAMFRAADNPRVVVGVYRTLQSSTSPSASLVSDEELWSTTMISNSWKVPASSARIGRNTRSPRSRVQMATATGRAGDSGVGGGASPVGNSAASMMGAK